MPTRHKPSKWKAPGFEALKDLRQSHFNELVDKALECGPPVRTEEHRQALRRTLFSVLLEIYASSVVGKRPTVPEKVAALRLIRSKTFEITLLLRYLDRDTRSSLEQAYSELLRQDIDQLSKHVNKERIASESFGRLDGDLALSDDARAIKRLWKSSRLAMRQMEPPPRGAPLNQNLRLAIDQLFRAWTDATGQEFRAKGPFYGSLKTALEPIVGAADIEGPVREVLYGPKAGKRGGKLVGRKPGN